jgi:phage-related protein
MNSEYSIIFYSKDDGTEPVKDFFDSLQPKMAAKMIRTIELLQKYGPDLRDPYSSFLDGDIFELRAKVGSDITRVLYFFYYDKQIILTNGFVKKTQKTPKKEITLANKYRTRYLERGR